MISVQQDLISTVQMDNALLVQLIAFHVLQELLANNVIVVISGMIKLHFASNAMEDVLNVHLLILV